MVNMNGTMVRGRPKGQHIRLAKPWAIEDLKRAYENYLSGKDSEIVERKQALRYYHGDQLSSAQLEILKDRKQQPIIDNQIKPNINTMVGFMSRVRGDPKGYANTQEHEEGADLASLTVNTELDESNWADLHDDSVLDAAVQGLAGVEMYLKEDNTRPGDMEYGLREFNPSDYFYDPRSSKPDFSDASFDGIGRWKTVADAIALMPDKAEEIEMSSTQTSDKLTSGPDKDNKWFIYNDLNNKLERVRIVECWYKSGTGYRWAIFTGATILYEGEGYFFDGKGEMVSRYIVFSADVDHDADRYGMVRDMKSIQDELNAWKMGLNYDILSRRLIIQGEDPQNLEKIRKEWSRKDGTVIIENPDARVVTDNKSVEINGAINAINDARNQLSKYNLDVSTQFQNDPNISGRAVKLLMEAGMSRLGPFIKNVKEWKLRVYRYSWAQIQRYYSGERWLRVTDEDDPGKTQWIMVNALVQDPVTGMPVIQNALGSLDVDIKLGEGDDYINSMEETFDTLAQMARGGVQVPPDVLIQMSPLDSATKKSLLGRMQEAAQPDPMQQQIQLQTIQAQLANLMADTQKKRADAAKSMASAMASGQDPLDQAEQLAGIENTQADTAQKMASARKTAIDSSRPPPTENPLDLAEQAARIAKLRQETARLDLDSTSKVQADAMAALAAGEAAAQPPL